jgi:ribosomal protein S12 methylthiotransferase accessory factor
LRDVIIALGEGPLTDLVAKELSGTYKLVHQKNLKTGIPKAASLCLVLHEEDLQSDHLETEKELKHAGIPWMSAAVLEDEGMVGPLVRPGRPGCYPCAQRRRLAAGQDRDNSLKLQMRLIKGEDRKPDRAASREGLIQMSYLIAAEVRRILSGIPAYTDGRVYLLNFKTLTHSLHSFLPDPSCEICGRLPDDGEEAARISLQPSPKIGSETYRCRPMDELSEVLFNDYRDDRTGMMNDKSSDRVSPFCDVVVSQPSLSGKEWTAGRSHSYQQSELTAILEGLERYCGMMPRGKQTRIHDSYQNLAARALNPVTVGLYSSEQYSLPDFPFEPFDAEVPVNWVWGFSFKEDRPLLVPEQLAYYSTGVGGQFVLEGSNGCALGGSLEEAIFYGILEAAERDSFLLTWYARMAVPRLDPHSVPDPEFRLMIQRFEAVAECDVFLFNCTMEYGIPSVWALAKTRKDSGANLICAAGAHLDPVRAAKSAVFELAAHINYLDYMSHNNRDEYLQMLDDPSLVSEMPDHALLYTLPEAEERLQFLLDPDRPIRHFADEFKPRVWHSDLTEDLTTLLQRFGSLKLDVIVVDQTTAETKRNGLHCVKVIIPGLLPMTFGHDFRRLAGLERVLRIPMELGFAQHMLSIHELNPHPHPFL